MPLKNILYEDKRSFKKVMDDVVDSVQSLSKKGSTYKLFFQKVSGPGVFQVSGQGIFVSATYYAMSEGEATSSQIATSVSISMSVLIDGTEIFNQSDGRAVNGTGLGEFHTVYADVRCITNGIKFENGFAVNFSGGGIYNTGYISYYKKV